MASRSKNSRPCANWPMPEIPKFKVGDVVREHVRAKGSTWTVEGIDTNRNPSRDREPAYKLGKDDARVRRRLRG